MWIGSWLNLHFPFKTITLLSPSSQNDLPSKGFMTRSKETYSRSSSASTTHLQAISVIDDSKGPFKNCCMVVIQGICVICKFVQSTSIFLNQHLWISFSTPRDLHFCRGKSRFDSTLTFVRLSIIFLNSIKTLLGDIGQGFEAILCNKSSSKQ